MEQSKMYDHFRQGDIVAARFQARQLWDDIDWFMLIHERGNINSEERDYYIQRSWWQHVSAISRLRELGD